MRRFWTMLAHWHGQTWNASELGRSMSTTDKTVRRYLDVLTGTYMVRQVPPWFENLAKRQVNAPKIYLRDTGILHALLGTESESTLLSHPRVGASWQGFAVEQVLGVLHPANAWFWAAHGGGEVDLLILEHGRRLGFEMKFSEAPEATKSMRNIVDTLGLDHLFVVCPSRDSYPVHPRISVLSVFDCSELAKHIQGTVS